MAQLARIVDWIVCLVLTLAALGKIIDMPERVRFGQPALELVLDAAVISVELGLAYCLIARMQHGLVRWATVFLLMCFIVVNAWKISAGITSCDCFGTLLETTPHMMIVVDTALCILMMSAIGVAHRCSVRHERRQTPALKSQPEGRVAG